MFYLEEKSGAEEDICDGEPEEGGESREKHSAEVEVLAARSKHGRYAEAREYNRRSQKRLHHLAE